MKLIWTKNNLPLSKLICWGLQEPVSHFAIVFDNKVVFHSNLKGAHIEWYTTFKKHNDIVLEIDVPLPLEQEEAIWQSIVDENDEKSYDYGAFFYFIYRVLALRIFNRKLPAKNKWAKSAAFLCVGLAETLPKDLFPQLANMEDFEIVSPYQLYLVLTSRS